MRTPERRILVTGAAGFIGRALMTALLGEAANATARIVLLDAVPASHTDARIEAITGDLTDPHTISAAIGGGVDVVYHLAAVVGAAAEADYALARRVNVDATLTLFEQLRDSGVCPRVVNASSVAVFGEPPPPRVDDQTVPRPTMTYGAQKRMMEIALAQFSVRGWLDGLSLRLPAIVAKPVQPGVKAVFLNQLFHAFAAGENMIMPVSASGTAWLLSTEACIAALLHAGQLLPAAIGQDRSLILPALRVTMRELIDALARRYGGAGTRIDFEPDARLEAQFASQPPLTTAAANRLGFQHDGDVNQLVRSATRASAQTLEGMV